MIRRSLVLLVAVGALVRMAPACAVGGPDGQLNPQPLPPASEDDSQAPGGKQETATGSSGGGTGATVGNSSSSSSGGSGTSGNPATPPYSTDASAPDAGPDAN